MKLGLRRGTVAVEPHDRQWEVTAQQTIAKLREILGDTAVDIQHIGSTSIKDICAKPIIDIVVGVRDFRDILEKNEILEKNGFIFRGHDVPDQYLYVCGDESTRTHHIHTVIYNSEAWNNYINMRDYLNCHNEEAQAYSELKEKVARQYPDDRNRYTELKSGLIAEILKKANNWRYK
ncbi:GrpB family protein [Ruminococcus flavefaciens]|uniref:GrpB family protein n=1 Tax=Ruminococcus flavefaciens TaxID=1265 RepID=UPI003EFF0DAF